MVALLVASFLMTALYFMGNIMIPLVLVKFEFMKTLPGGVVSQDINATTLLTLVGGANSETWGVNMGVTTKVPIKL